MKYRLATSLMTQRYFIQDISRRPVYLILFTEMNGNVFPRRDIPPKLVSMCIEDIHDAASVNCNNIEY